MPEVYGYSNGTGSFINILKAFITITSLICSFLEEPELMQRCWDAQAEIALLSEGFTDIDFNTLLTIMRRETLNCGEITVFRAAREWARAECGRREEEPTPENMR